MHWFKNLFPCSWRYELSRTIILLSICIGIISAMGAAALFLGLELVSHLCQNQWMGVPHPVPRGEHIPFREHALVLRPWLIVLLPTLGGLLSGLLVYKFAPEAEGHGMDATIRAFHHLGGVVRGRVPFVKGLASIITIGTGGSGGREGPIAQIGGGIGSWVAAKLRLDVRQRRIFMLAGTAGGIGSIFRAPLGGALSTVELLYREDFESSAIIPCVISSVTAYTLFRWFLSLPFIGISSATIYAFPELSVHLPWDVVYAVIVGGGCAVAGKLYVIVFKTARQRIFPRIFLPRALRPALGGLMVGLIGLVAVETLGSGHGYLQKAIDTRVAGLPQAQLLPLAASFLIFAVLKMLTTSITIGSGGSGGVFGPSLLIGGLVGAAIGCCCHAFLRCYVPPLPVFVVLGMAGFFAGVANAPIGSLIMVSEMTGSYTLVAPLLVVCVASLLLNRRHSIYESQLENRFESPAHRSLMVTDVLADAKVAGYYHPSAVPVVHHTETVTELRRLLADQAVPFPLTVVDQSDQPCGILSMGNIRPVYAEDTPETLLLVVDMMSDLVFCTPDEPLASALRKFESSGCSRIPVADITDSRRLLGYIQYQDVMRAYEQELQKQRLMS